MRPYGINTFEAPSNTSQFAGRVGYQRNRSFQAFLLSGYSGFPADGVREGTYSAESCVDYVAWRLSKETSRNNNSGLIAQINDGFDTKLATEAGDYASPQALRSGTFGAVVTETETLEVALWGNVTMAWSTGEDGWHVALSQTAQYEQSLSQAFVDFRLNTSPLSDDVGELDEAIKSAFERFVGNTRVEHFNRDGSYSVGALNGDHDFPLYVRRVLLPAELRELLIFTDTILPTDVSSRDATVSDYLNRAPDLWDLESFNRRTRSLGERPYLREYDLVPYVGAMHLTF